MPLDKPLKPTGGLAILRGSLAPDSCVIKLSGHNKRKHSGPGARVRTRGRRHGRGERTGKIKPNDVMVIRYEGPRGGPGMREMLLVTARGASARGWATASRCSPMAVSAAPRTAS